MRFTFRNKAILFISPIIIVISMIYTVADIRSERKLLQEELIKRGELVAGFAAKTAELPILSENIDFLHNASRSLIGLKNIPFVVFYNKDLQPLVHEGLDVPEHPAGDCPAVEPRHFPGDFPATPSITTIERPEYFEFLAPVFTERLREGLDILQESAKADTVKELIGWAEIGLSKEIIFKGEKKIIRNGVIFALLFTSVAIVLTSLLINYAIKPLNDLFKAVVGLKEGEFPRIVTIQSSDEIGLLSIEFNRMTKAIKNREQRLIESEARIKALFDRVQHAIFRLDSDFLIIEANKTFSELCDYPPNFLALFRDEKDDLFLEKFLAGALINTEETIIDKNGNTLIVLLSVYPELDENGKTYRFDGYFMDITEKKKLEETILQSQKLESLGLLAGGIAHDFNNILTGILGYSSMLKEGVPVADERYFFADSIEQAAQRAANLTRQLLGFARKGKYQNRRINVNDLITELLGFLKETFDRNITISLEIDKDAPLIVMGDGNQLYQTMLNLCINSRDAMPEGGRLFIRTEATTIVGATIGEENYQLQPGNYIKIRITDTGQGMSVEVKKRIFEPFYTTKEAGKGTGLGLSMVYGIIKNHGGHISVYSEPGTGTTFHIYLPAAPLDIPEQKAEPSVRTEPTKGTILFADDEQPIRTLVTSLLKTIGHTVLLAENGKEAVAIFNENQDTIDLVILDMVMPEMGGKQAFKELLEIKPDAKVLLCSGHGEEQYFHELFEAGASGFLQKPFQVEELFGKIDELIKSRQT